MNDTPKIRFNEFTDEWEQRKLGEVADKVTEKNTQNLYSETFTNSAEFGVISQRDFFDHDISNANNIGGYYIVKAEDFVYNPRISVTAPCGPINCNRLGRNGVMSPLYTVFRTHDIDTVYIEWYFKSHYWHSYMYFNGDTGARSDRFSIKSDLFFQMPIPVPSVPEQRKIGNVLTDLDNLITLHQRKYEQMINVKKSMLDRLFPYDGAKNPQIRFGFSENWEEVKLGDIVFPYSDPVETPHDGYTRLGIRSHGKGTFHDYVQAGQELETAQMHRVAAHKFIVNITFGWEHAVAITNEQDAGKLVSHRFPQFSMTDSVDDSFLKYVILDERFKHHLFLSSPGGAGRNRVLNIPQMLEYKTRIPKIEEQRQIAGLLNSVNNLIDLYAEKVQKLKQIKSACLDKMFI